MGSITLFSNKEDHQQVSKDNIEGAFEHFDFEPEIALFYAILKYKDKYKYQLNILYRVYAYFKEVIRSWLNCSFLHRKFSLLKRACNMMV